jgi:hypothetical protein
VPANTTTNPTRFRWPRKYALESWMVLTRLGTPASLGAVNIRIQDAEGDELITDGQNLATLSPFLTPLGGVGFQRSILALPGGAGAETIWGLRWMPLNRTVVAGEQWIFQVDNDSGVSVTPEVLFKLGEVK